MIDKIVHGASSSQFRAKKATKRADSEAQLLELESERKQDRPQPQTPFVERRSGKDRRQNKQHRVVYDMRQSAGRRKTDRKYPPIETDA